MTNQDILTVSDILLPMWEQTPGQAMSFAIKEGTINVLYGLSGSGKTTLARYLAGLNMPSHGTVKLFNTHIHKKLSRENIAYLSAEPIFPKGLTAWKVLRLTQKLYREDFDQNRATSLALELGLDPQHLAQPMEKLDKDIQFKVGLLGLFMTSCPLLVLENPFKEMDSLSEKLLMAFMDKARDMGQTVVFTSATQKGVLELCDTIFVLHKSMLVLESLVPELLDQMQTQNLDDACLALIEQFDLNLRADKIAA